MPELPEIETIKHVIEPQITGLAIEKGNIDEVMTMMIRGEK